MASLLKASGAVNPLKPPEVAAPRRPPIPSIHMKPKLLLAEGKSPYKQIKPIRTYEEKNKPSVKSMLEGMPKTAIIADAIMAAHPAIAQMRAESNIKKGRTEHPASYFSEYLGTGAGLGALGLSYLGFKGGLKAQKEDADLVNKVIKKARKYGVNVPVFKHPSDATAAFYAPGHGVVVGSEYVKKPAVWAHELGHASMGKKLPLSAQLFMGKGSKYLGGTGAAAGAYLAGNLPEEYSLPAALAGTALSAPMVGEELRASAVGSKYLTRAAKPTKLLSKIGLRLSPFVGVPTYLAGASAPLAAYQIRKWLNKRHRTPKNKR